MSSPHSTDAQPVEVPDFNLAELERKFLTLGVITEGPESSESLTRTALLWKPTEISTTDSLFFPGAEALEQVQPKSKYGPWTLSFLYVGFLLLFLGGIILLAFSIWAHPILAGIGGGLNIVSLVAFSLGLHRASLDDARSK